jgi:hypothetical protein
MAHKVTAMDDWRKKTTSVEPPELGKLDMKKRNLQLGSKKSSQLRDTVRKKKIPILDDLIMASHEQPISYGNNKEFRIGNASSKRT